MIGVTFAKRWLILGLVPLVALLIAGSGIVWAATVANGSFETGDLTGWSTVIPTNGFISIVSSADGETPKDGALFARLKTNGPGSFTILSQSVTVSAGDEVSGYAYFADAEGLGNCFFNDTAEVTVGETIVFSANSCLTSTKPWTLWTHTFGAAGTFLIEAKITNGGDTYVDSFMGLDAVVVTYTSSPDNPPTMSLPDDITGVEATGPGGATVNFTVTANDDEDGNLTPICRSSSGSEFGITTTTVNCSVTDSGNNTVTGSFDVTVEDTTAPSISGLYATPDTLWAPNHKMTDVTVTAHVFDAVDDSPSCVILAVSDNDTNDSSDWEFSEDDLNVELRAERSGNGDARVYAITVLCVDDEGNASEGEVKVTVPHDQGKGKGKK